MARAGEVVAVAPEGSPHGSTAALQRQLQAVPHGPADSGPQPGPAGVEQPQVAPPGLADIPQFTGDLNNGLDHKLFGPTERPNEPVTAGMPFGPGHSFSPDPQESTGEFMARVADALDQSPAKSPAIQAYIDRIKRGA